MSRVLRFANNTLVATHDPLEPGMSPQIADSFLCVNGRVRGFSIHRRRLERDLALIAPQLLTELDEFYAEMARELADEPEVFPRIDVFDDSLWLRVRPVPELTKTVAAVSQRDQLENARVKGPNIAHYTELNARHGCETLRMDEQGDVLEGVTSAVLWWTEASGAGRSGSNASLHVVASTDRVWSTTEDLVTQIASEHSLGVTSQGTVEPRTVDLETLQHSEVWLVNALQGIRAVTTIDGKPLPPPKSERFLTFQAALQNTWEPIPS